MKSFKNFDVFSRNILGYSSSHLYCLQLLKFMTPRQVKFTVPQVHEPIHVRLLNYLSPNTTSTERTFIL